MFYADKPVSTVGTVNGIPLQLVSFGRRFSGPGQTSWPGSSLAPSELAGLFGLSVGLHPLHHISFRSVPAHPAHFALGA